MLERLNLLVGGLKIHLNKYALGVAPSDAGSSPPGLFHV